MLYEESAKTYRQSTQSSEEGDFIELIVIPLVLQILEWEKSII